MEALIVIAIVFAFSLYYDLKHRGIPIIIPAVGIPAAIITNVVFGRYEIFDGVFVLSLFIVMFIFLLMAFRVIRSGDAYLLIVISIATPFVGFLIPSIVCLIISLIAGYLYCIAYCQIQNSHAKKLNLKPYSDILYKKRSDKFLLKYFTYLNTKGTVHAVSAVDIIDNKMYLDPTIGRKQKGLTDARYVIPVIPLVPFIVSAYVVLLFITLF